MVVKIHLGMNSELPNWPSMGDFSNFDTLAPSDKLRCTIRRCYYTMGQTKMNTVCPDTFLLEVAI